MSDDRVTHEGVAYYLSKNLPPLDSHVETCPACGAVGQLYGRNCKTCKGRGLLFTPLSARSSTAA